MTLHGSEKISVLPASHGLGWLMQSLALVRAQPARLLFLVLLLQLILGLSRLPVLGVLVIIAMPALSAGILQAFRLVAQGQRPTAALLFVPLAARPRTGRLLALGAVLLVAGIFSLSMMLAGSENLLDAELLARIEKGEIDALAALDPVVVRRFVLAVLVTVAVSGTLSYLAVPLIWFREEKLGSALVRGLGALFRNWKPFTVLALGLMALMLPLAVAAGMLFYLAGAAGALSFVFVSLIMIFTLAFQLVIFGTQYCAFRDIFGLEAEGGSTGPDAGQDSGPNSGPNSGQDDQLLA